jgi:signal transduction histidine kinase
LDFAAKAAVVLPLLARGKTLGALVLAQGPSGRSYFPTDVALAEGLAHRAAVSLDNARLYRDIQEGDRRKNEFLAMLAHELRNPLAPIRNAVQILRMCGSDQPDLSWALEVMERQMQQLVRMVDDLLDVSRITRGKINLQKELTDVASLVHSAVESSRPLLDERKHELTVSLPAQPVFVEADPARLAQVLANLLNNAAKYTEEGGQVWLTVEQDEGEVVFRVRDTGMGIPASMLSSVFDLFTQADRSLDRSQGGLGIGLTLVRQLVELHGGSVQAHSAGPGQGSEFVVRLPTVTAGPARPPSGNGVHEPGNPGRCCRILIVDDNVDSAESLGLLLSVKGHDVRTVHDGATALTAARTFLPEVILLDIGLPRMDGYEVARRLRQEPGLEGVLLVALTGYGQEEDRRRSLEAGFNHHFVKPVDTQALEELFAHR